METRSYRSDNRNIKYDDNTTIDNVDINTVHIDKSTSSLAK
jgi:hypothetical protein